MIDRPFMRLFTTIAFLLTCTTSAANAAWVHDAARDAVVSQATSYKGPGRPELVVVCNNMVTLTYVRWPSDFGVDKKQLPSHVAVDYTLAGYDADAVSLKAQVWTVARPTPEMTQMITHDLTLPIRMAEGASMTVMSGAKEPLPGLDASFDLTGLKQALIDTYLPCSKEAKFMLKSVEEKAAEKEAIRNAAKKKNKIASPPLPNFNP